MNSRQALSLVPLVGLCAYFVGSIYYVFPSGTPQPADYVLLATIALTILFAWRRMPSDRDLYVATGLFIGWIILVNTSWFLVVSEFRFLIVSTFYAFNVLVFLFVIAVANHDFPRLRTFIWWSCLAALVLQIVTVHLAPMEGTSRAIGTFNNPNQLGYWALLVMACLAVIKHRTPIGVWDVAAFSICLYATILSASRAASVAALLLAALIIYFCRFEKTAGRVAIGVLVVGLIAGIASGGLITRLTETAPVANLLGRFEARDQGEDLAARGYTRIIEHPQYLVFGAGEGEKDRFTEPDDAKEFHSSLGNLFFSYGLVGLGLFGYLLFIALRRAPWPSIAYFGPVMLYGLGHMGLRFSLFWVVLALIYAQGRHRYHRTATSRGTGRHRAGTSPSGLRPQPAGAAGALARGDDAVPSSGERPRQGADHPGSRSGRGPRPAPAHAARKAWSRRRAPGRRGHR